MFQGHTGHNSENKNNGLTNSYLRAIVSIYTNGRTIQDITYNGQLVNPIGFHYESFKANSYFFWCMVSMCALSSSLCCKCCLFSLFGQFYSYGELLKRKRVFGNFNVKLK